MLQKTKIKIQPSDIDASLEAQIYVMPQRFYQAPKSRRLSGLIIILLLGFLLLFSLGIAAWYLNSNLNQTSQPSVNLNQPLPLPLNLNQTANLNQNVNLNQNLNANTNNDSTTLAATTTPLNSKENLNINVDINANFNVNGFNNNRLTPLPLTDDSDADSLTAAEENLFGTDVFNSDTDGDSYSDGAELLAGYDPTKPKTPLANTNLFAVYNHPFYSLIYPAAWLLKEQDQEKNEVLLTSATGEFVEILVIDNNEKLSLLDWYAQQFPSSDLAQVTAVKINSLSGLRQPDYQSYYLMQESNPAKIFLLTYNIGNFTTTNFATTFQVIVKSFKLLP
jgi:hypothetical protein